MESQSNFEPKMQTERQIDRIVSEISGILHAIGEPVPQPQNGHDAATRLRIEQARERQLAERERFLKRYQSAILAFIGAILRDPEAVAEVWDSFVPKWLAGRLARFDPDQGSFRKYLKTVLRNECSQHWMRLAKQRYEVSLASEYEHADDLHNGANKAFDQHLRTSLLNESIQAVAEEDTRHGEIVKFMVGAKSGPRPTSQELAEHLKLQLGMEYSLANVRQLKKRAKECLAEKLIEQTGLSIDSCSLSDVEDALAELSLLHFCRNKIAEMRN